MPPPSSPDAVERKFTLFDALLFVAAAALAMALVRTKPYVPPLPDMIIKSIPVVLLCANFYFIAIRLISPRPRGQHLWRQPGWIASISAFLPILLFLIREFACSIFDFHPYGFGGSHWADVKEFLYDKLTSEAFRAVCACWTTLALSGVWRSEKGWIDRFGRTLGVCWLGYPSCCWIYWLAKKLLWPGSHVAF